MSSASERGADGGREGQSAGSGEGGRRREGDTEYTALTHLAHLTKRWGSGLARALNPKLSSVSQTEFHRAFVVKDDSRCC